MHQVSRAVQRSKGRLLPHAAAQATVSRDVTFCGVGLHSGDACELTISPAPANHGITFQRPPAPPVRATFGSVIDTTLSTVLASAPPAPLGRRAQRAGYLLSRLGIPAGSWLAGSTVATVEHLMAALSGAGIHNAAVSMTGGEVPVMDGSARCVCVCLCVCVFVSDMSIYIFMYIHRYIHRYIHTYIHVLYTHTHVSHTHTHTHTHTQGLHHCPQMLDP